MSGHRNQFFGLTLKKKERDSAGTLEFRSNRAHSVSILNSVENRQSTEIAIVGIHQIETTTSERISLFRNMLFFIQVHNKQQQKNNNRQHNSVMHDCSTEYT
jgi:hypothetical protein